jgi:DNA-binding response OmpR family regulator
VIDSRAGTMSIRALLIDDDARLFELLSAYLDKNGVQAAYARDGAEGLRMLEAGAFDVLLLDVMMPGLDGLQVLQRVRARSALPVIMLTAKGDETDRVVGLEMGADDYVAKPFSPRELLARIRAVVRRTQVDVMGERLSASGVVADVPTREVRVEGEPVELTGVEFDILVALLRRAGRVVPRSALLDEAGRQDVVVGERTVDVHVSRLRRKLGDDPRSPRLIKTVRGVGYVLTRGGT